MSGPLKKKADMNDIVAINDRSGVEANHLDRNYRDISIRFFTMDGVSEYVKLGIVWKRSK